MPLLIGSAVAIVGIVVVAFFMFRGGNAAGTPSVTPSAAAPAAGASPASPADAALVKTDAMQDAAKAEADALAKELAGGDTKPTTDVSKPSGEADAAASKPVAKKTTKKEPKAAAPKPAEKKVLTAEDVFDSRTLPPLDYPADVEQSTRDEINTLCEDVRNGGLAGRQAKKRLEEIGHPAIVGVVNAYAKIDFKNPDQAMYAFELNKLLTNAFGAGVVNANYKPTQAGEAIPLEIADWNAKTVHAWRRFWEKHADKQVWENMVKKRKEGKAAEGEAKGDDKDK